MQTVGGICFGNMAIFYLPILCATVPEVLFRRVAAVVLPRFFSLSGRWMELLSLRWWHHVFYDSAGQESRILETRKLWGMAPRAFNQPPSLGKAPIYNGHQVKSFVPSPFNLLHGLPSVGLTLPPQRRNPFSDLSSIPVLSVLPHILDLGFLSCRCLTRQRSERT